MRTPWGRARTKYVDELQTASYLVGHRPLQGSSRHGHSLASPPRNGIRPHRRLCRRARTERVGSSDPFYEPGHIWPYYAQSTSVSPREYVNYLTRCAIPSSCSSVGTGGSTASASSSSTSRRLTIVRNGMMAHDGRLPDNSRYFYPSTRDFTWNYVY